MSEGKGERWMNVQSIIVINYLTIYVLFPAVSFVTVQYELFLVEPSIILYSMSYLW